MSILWIYHAPIDPNAGGTERATHLVMSALQRKGHESAGFLVFEQVSGGGIYDAAGHRVEDLYGFLKSNEVHLVVNQIGYSKWLLQEFLVRGGARWKAEGGRVITCLHFDPEMFSESASALLRHWNRKTLLQKVRRLVRIVHLPIARRRAIAIRNQAYSYLLENSDRYVLLSERHRKKLQRYAGGGVHDRVCVIPNMNTYACPVTEAVLGRKEKTALIVSRLDEPQKRISLALRAWALAMKGGEFPDWTLKVLGDGDYSEDYRTLVAKRRIPNVVFIGRADPEPYYEQASLYLHTAEREGWGLTITEAMQKGVVPIVMHSSAVFEDLIRDGRTGILSRNGSVKALAANIVALMRDDTLRWRMAAKAVEATAQHEAAPIVEKWSAIVGRAKAARSGAATLEK